MLQKYTAKSGSCKFSKTTGFGTKITGHKSMGAGTEANLMTAVATFEPIAVTVHAEDDFGDYKSGMFFIYNFR